jgi:3-oxosteroid 1-dehydrogenase
VIEGVFSAGNAREAVMAHSYACAGSTIGPAMTFGYIAARTMAGLDVTPPPQAPAG